MTTLVNPFALRRAKTTLSFGPSDCSRVKKDVTLSNTLSKKHPQNAVFMPENCEDLCSVKAPKIFFSKNISTLELMSAYRLEQSWTNSFVKGMKH